MDRKERFKERFGQHYSRLCRLAYGYVGDRDECEDIVQELFVNVWNKGRDELPEREFAAYMSMAVRNSCISYLRRRRTDTVPLDELPDAAHAAGLDYQPGDGDERRPADVLDEALGVLPPRCREVFLLAKLEGLKYREIADRLEVSEKTVENQMVKAVKLLRAYVAQHGWATAVVASVILSIIANC